MGSTPVEALSPNGSGEPVHQTLVPHADSSGSPAFSRGRDGEWVVPLLSFFIVTALRLIPSAPMPPSLTGQALVAPFMFRRLSQVKKLRDRCFLVILVLHGPF